MAGGGRALIAQAHAVSMPPSGVRAHGRQAVMSVWMPSFVIESRASWGGHPATTSAVKQNGGSATSQRSALPGRESGPLTLEAIAANRPKERHAIDAGSPRGPGDVAVGRLQELRYVVALELLEQLGFGDAQRQFLQRLESFDAARRR